jgi:hypothetical protein
MKKDRELPGAVESMKFVNSHGSLTVAVKDPDGEVPSCEERQSVGLPENHRHAGWTRDPDFRR